MMLRESEREKEVENGLGNVLCCIIVLAAESYISRWVFISLTSSHRILPCTMVACTWEAVLGECAGNVCVWVAGASCIIIMHDKAVATKLNLYHKAIKG